MSSNNDGYTTDDEIKSKQKLFLNNLTVDSSLNGSMCKCAGYTHLKIKGKRVFAWKLFVFDIINEKLIKKSAPNENVYIIDPDIHPIKNDLWDKVFG